MNRRAILIAGPTASGKSALALEKARLTDGVIINTDSMQVYQVLNVLSARPQLAAFSQAEHLLYGHVSPCVRYSTGAWCREVQALLDTPALEGLTLIFVGGTGLYFQSLIDGFIDIPEIPLEVLQKIEAEIAPLDRDQRRRLLSERDPEMAKRLVEPDRQRIVRALSVLEATGRSLASWQDEKQVGLLQGYDLEKIVISPARDVLRDRIANRFESMMQSGGIDEVRKLQALDLDLTLPVMKAIGVREIGKWLAGSCTKDEAIERAVIATYQYAKRQRTWFRKRMADWNWHE